MRTKQIQERFDNVELVDFEAGMDEEMAQEAFRRCAVHIELLEACRGMVRAYENEDADAERIAIMSIKKAIAKAEGMGE